VLPGFRAAAERGDDQGPRSERGSSEQAKQDLARESGGNKLCLGLTTARRVHHCNVERVSMRT